VRLVKIEVPRNRELAGPGTSVSQIDELSAGYDPAWQAFNGTETCLSIFGCVWKSGPGSGSRSEPHPRTGENSRSPEDGQPRKAPEKSADDISTVFSDQAFDRRELLGLSGSCLFPFRELRPNKLFNHVRRNKNP